MILYSEKIIAFDTLAAWSARKRRLGGHRLVVTNGCFDLLHAGHVAYLRAARQLGTALLVGVNDDAAVRQLKGENRPVNCADDRAYVLAGLSCVTAVCVFSGTAATEFLIAAMPHVWCKGGDYRKETLNQDEVRAVEKLGGNVYLVPEVAGKSTSAMLRRV